jgi:tetratricopeptide (TPR) repeat protein
MYMRRAETSSAANAYKEAVELAEGGDDLNVLAHAYSGRAVVEATDRRYEEALADFGRARALSKKAGNVLGEAQIDMNLGSIMDIRGQPASAVRVLEDAARRLQALSSQEEWAVALQGVASAELRLLDSAAALRTSESFSPPHADIADERLGWSLALTRARALAANGRLAEAKASAQAIWDRASSPADSLFRANAAGALAMFASLSGEWKETARLAAFALTPELERADILLFIQAWQLRIAGLQHSAEISEARGATDAFVAWLATVPTDRSHVLITFAEAEQARAEGRIDDAQTAYDRAFAAAERSGVPEDVVSIGTPLANLLLQGGDVADAVSLAGRLAPWAGRDSRIADLQLRLDAAARTHGKLPAD